MAEILLHNGLDIASKSLSRIEVQTRPVSVHRKPAENKPLRSSGPTLFGGYAVKSDAQFLSFSSKLHFKKKLAEHSEYHFTSLTNIQYSVGER